MPWNRLSRKRAIPATDEFEALVCVSAEHAGGCVRAARRSRSLVPTALVDQARPNGSPPGNGHLVRPKPLVHDGIANLHADAAAVHLQPSPGNHRAIVDAQ